MLFVVKIVYVRIQAGLVLVPCQQVLYVYKSVVCLAK